MKLERIELSATTQRLRRNLVGAAFLIFVIRGLNLSITGVNSNGIQISPITTTSVIIIITAFLLYNTIAFVIHCLDEYHFWNLNLAIDETARMDTDEDGLTLTQQLQMAAPILKKLKDFAEKSGNSAIPDFTKIQWEQLSELAENAAAYIKGLNNFSRAMKFRLIGWDICLPIFIAALAIVFAFEPHASGLFSQLASPESMLPNEANMKSQ